jgi:hypothetical protein
VDERREGMKLESRAGSSNGRAKWLLVPLLAIIAVLLLAEHRAHIPGVLPYILGGIAFITVLALVLATRWSGGRGVKR